jgi:hypothetical protein
MSVYQTSLLGRSRVADGTMAFQFEKPKHFNFKPGQYIELTISDPENEISSPITHTFLIASSPLSQDLLLTTRMRNTLFKRTLACCPSAERRRSKDRWDLFISIRIRPGQPCFWPAESEWRRFSAFFLMQRRKN